MGSDAPKQSSGLSALADTPNYEITVEPAPQPMQVVFNGETIADSNTALVLRETRHADVIYFPRADVSMDLLRRTDHHSFCPYKGEASYWSIEAGGKTVENAAWSYENAFDDMAEIKDYIAFYMDRLNAP